ncbi:MAG: carbon-nitrogen hydrolase family protein [Arcobacter sp.]|uniref:carbon-nitrogen hydrolase family protein n=1 Tax=Arcobacter sp. TaxID=1872629 RepID=UPI003AFFBF97
MNLITLQTKPSTNFQDNLDHLEELILQTPKESFILAPELSLTGYAYGRIIEAGKFTKKAIEKLTLLSKERTISLTMTNKECEDYFNTFYIFHKGKIIHKQSKIKLFALNDENKYFESGREEDIKLFEIDELKIGVLVCFELRFIDYWQKLKGADIILIPAMWGAKRKDNYETLSKALAVANQCFVIASDSADESCAKGSAIITPFGDVTIDDNKEIISKTIDLKEIKLMRKYLDVGIQ